MRINKLKHLGLVSAIVALGISGFANAGKITTEENATGTEGFGGWNLDNVEVLTFKEELTVPDEELIPTDTPFDETDGSYDAEYFTFVSLIDGYNASAATSTVMGILRGKDWPVGEPAGIKVIHDDSSVKDPKPANCIMTTSYLGDDETGVGFLDQPPLNSTTCGSPFQSHKRFKVNMLTGSLDTDQNIGTYEGAVDLVFNVEPGLETDYQVFQKMNNYTGSRLEGFAVQVGTGTSTAFTASSAPGGVGLATLSLWASEKTGDDPELGIWDEDQIATFSHGLFGPVDKHFPETGFFDSRKAGFMLASGGIWPKAAGDGDTLKSGDLMPNNYAAVPVPGSPTAIDSQFGPWLHDQIAPMGIFFDDDDDPDTDAALLAFWGDVTGDGTTFAWMRGEKDGFALVEPAALSEWQSDTSDLYSIGVIEDMLNLGLNYVVTVGDIALWPENSEGDKTFTLRLIPLEDSSGTPDPAYVANPPSGIIADRGTVHVAASPRFYIGDLLTITVADSNALSTVNVTLENLNNGDMETGVVLTESALDSGYYVGTIGTSDDDAHSGTDGVLYVQPGDEIKVTYSDADPVNDVFASTTGGEATTFYVVPTPGGGAAVFDL